MGALQFVLYAAAVAQIVCAVVAVVLLHRAQQALKAAQEQERLRGDALLAGLKQLQRLARCCEPEAEVATCRRSS